MRYLEQGVVYGSYIACMDTLWGLPGACGPMTLKSSNCDYIIGLLLNGGLKSRIKHLKLESIVSSVMYIFSSLNTYWIHHEFSIIKSELKNI